MTRHDVLTLLNEAGLGDYTDAAYHLLQPALRLETVPATDDELPVGASKMGGWPDLPPTTPWPHWKGIDGTWEPARPLHFLAQINVADARAAIAKGYTACPELALPGHQMPLDFGEPIRRIAPDVPHMPLPQSGLLSVFYDADDQPWQDCGEDSEEGGGFRILYTPADVPLERCTIPAELQALMQVPPPIFRARRLSLSLVTPTHPLRNLSVRDADATALEEVLDRVEPESDSDSGEHQLLGLADYIQTDPAATWAREEVEARGIDLYDPAAGPEPWDALAWAARQLLLLLQIDSDADLKWLWGDCGKLYFHVRKADLSTCDFTRVRLELQSH